MSNEIQSFNGSFNDLKNKIASIKGLIVLDFYATWCSPCMRLMNILPSIADENKNVTFIKIEVDKNQELVEKFNVIAMPYLFFIKADQSEEGFTQIDEMMGNDIKLVQKNIKLYS